MARIRLLRRLVTDKTVLETGREILATWQHAAILIQCGDAELVSIADVTPPIPFVEKIVRRRQTA